MILIKVGSSLICYKSNERNQKVVDDCMNISKEASINIKLFNRTLQFESFGLSYYKIPNQWLKWNYKVFNVIEIIVDDYSIQTNSFN